MSDANPLTNLGEQLYSPVFKGATKAPGRFAFRGEMALKFTPSIAGEKRPPEIKADQVIITAEGETIPFFACHVMSLAHLDLVKNLLGKSLVPGGKYFIFAGNVDISKKYLIELDGIPIHILPLDEATVYNELIELFYLDKGDLKKVGGEGKIDAIANAAAKFSGKFAAVPYAQALAEMGPVKVAENRPV
ncbi:MAG: hypothetical protein LLG15_08675 [Betaproteobacteria bacterium]|nr:hypothetical protein [Betaproteobacteria bacterium]